MEIQEGKPQYSGRQEAQEVNRLPAIAFHVSEEGDNVPYKDDLSIIQCDLEPAWRAVEAQVLSSFEEVTGGTWDEFFRTNGISVTLTATGGSRTHRYKYLQLGCREVKSRWAKKQGVMGTMRGVHSLLGSLIHELGHNFMSRDDIRFMRETFGQRYDRESTKLDEERFFNEVYAELVSQAVAARNFTEDEIAPWIERQRLGHKGVYDFLDMLSKEEKQVIIDRRQPSRTPQA